MVGLGAEYQVHGGSAAHDLLAFGLSDAAGHRDEEIAVALLEPLQLAELGIDLLGRPLADVAGVEHDEIGGRGILGLPITGAGKNVSHALAVIGIHLTAVGLDKNGPGCSHATPRKFRATAIKCGRDCRQ